MLEEPTAETELTVPSKSLLMASTVTVTVSPFAKFDTSYSLTESVTFIVS